MNHHVKIKEFAFHFARGNELNIAKFYHHHGSQYHLIIYKNEEKVEMIQKYKNKRWSWDSDSGKDSDEKSRREKTNTTIRMVSDIITN